MSNIDTDKVAEAFKGVLSAVNREGVSTETKIVVESRLQTVWAEVNDNVTEAKDMEAIYPDE